MACCRDALDALVHAAKASYGNPQAQERNLSPASNASAGETGNTSCTQEVTDPVSSNAAKETASGISRGSSGSWMSPGGASGGGEQTVVDQEKPLEGWLYKRSGFFFTR